jgi:hypothetical protein
MRENRDPEYSPRWYPFSLILSGVKEHNFEFFKRMLGAVVSGL